MKTILIILFFTVLGWNSLTMQGQTQAPVRRDVHVLNVKIVNGDTIPHVNLKEVTVISQWRFKNKREEIVYTRLMRNVKIALPYARVASKKLYEINSNLALINGEKERRQYLSNAEKALFSEFEAPVRKLTFSQGKVLIKLIDRETGNTGYELIKEYKGGVSAFFWQGIARIFGANLKDGYKPDEEDAMIEHIVKMIDSGMI